MGALQAETAGYRLHVDEIRRYANLVAAMLGENLASLQGEERLRRCHALLEQHPYAYPFALELSLRLPPALAITWLRKLREAFYARKDVQDDIDAFQIWRMSPLQALTTALHHSASGRCLPGVMAYLKEQRPALAACLHGRSAPQSRRFRTPARMIRTVLATLGRLCGTETLPLRPSLLRFFLRSDNQTVRSRWRQLAAHCLAKVMLAHYEASAQKAFRFMPALPVEDEGDNRPGYQDKAGIDVVTVLWGSDYVQRWGSLNAPSLLAAANLPALAKEMPVRLVFYTTAADRKQIRELPVYRRLRQLASVRFVLMEQLLRESAPELLGIRFADKYAPMTAAHNHSMHQAAREQRYIFFNFPDMIWQEDTLSQLAALIRYGKTHILYYPGPYLTCETAEPEIRGHVHDGVLTLNNEAMRALCAAHRHPSALLFQANAPLRYFGAIMRMYPARGGNLIHMACFVPLVIKPDLHTFVRETIDADHPLSPRLDPEEVCLLTDNTSICAASLDPLEAQSNAMRWPPYSLAGFTHDFRAGMRLWNRIFFSLPCRFHGTTVNEDAAWQEASKEALRDVAFIQSRGSDGLPVPPIDLFLKGARTFLQDSMEKEACTN